MIDFATLKGLTIPEGVVVKIESGGVVLWELQTGGKVILEVAKITSMTYAGETSYSDENFILLDIYPKTNGTVSVTYGGLTKTITDTSGAAEPNAQQVFFGTLYGVSDSEETPASGTLTIEGDCAAFGYGVYKYNSKGNDYECACVTKIVDFGMVDHIPDRAFYKDFTTPSAIGAHKLASELVISSTIKTIGASAFYNRMELTDVTIGEGVVSIGQMAFNTPFARPIPSVTMLSKNPPELVADAGTDGTKSYLHFTGSVSDETGNDMVDTYPTFTVPKGCGEAYKTAEGWNTMADYIMEASE